MNAQIIPASITLPNGWKLSPVGKSFDLGDLPLNIAVSKSGNWMAVTNNGHGVQAIQLIETTSNKVLDSIVIGRSFYGLQFSSDEKYLYASGGHDNMIIRYALKDKHLYNKDTFKLGAPWPNAIGPSGIALDEKRNLLYVVTREDKQLYIFDLTTRKIVKKLGLDGEAYTCVLSPNNNELYISCWGCDQLNTLDLTTFRWKTSIKVGDNPNEMVVSPNGKFLYLCNSNDNSISVIDLTTHHVIETLDAALYPNSPSGSTTNSVSLDFLHKRLYIANANNNCIAVFDVSKPGQSVGKGYIPVGWYPTSVRVVNNKLWVANGKGFTSKPNPFGPSPVRPREEVISHGASFKPGSEVEYIGDIFKGTMSVIDLPTDKNLSNYTKAVYKNVPYSAAKTIFADSTAPGFPIPMKMNQSSPIKYVFYVIKENRTYDQVLSDIPTGNGDTSLLLFGKNITPNLHHIAESFVLLDNFYVDAEVSADGHNWSLGAHANDFLEKTWPSGYSNRGGVTDGMGRRQIANDKDGFIWDFCKKANVSYRTYGVFQDNEKGNIPSLRGKECSYFSTFYLTNIRDTTRYQQWKRDFDSLIAINAVPHFNSVRFGSDHTVGMAVGKPTPFACVADNDLAVGLFIEHLSQSSIWNESAVFIVEDDAQNGPDHVDAHRSNALVISPYTKRKFVDHTLYSTSGMLRTMELILGLPPMSQYDAAAMPMWRSFTSTPNYSKYQSLLSSVNLNDLNKINSPSARRSEKLDFSDADKINDHVFNEILWKGIKGENAIVPAPRRTAFVRIVD